MTVINTAHDEGPSPKNVNIKTKKENNPNAQSIAKSYEVTLPNEESGNAGGESSTKFKFVSLQPM